MPTVLRKFGLLALLIVGLLGWFSAGPAVAAPEPCADLVITDVRISPVEGFQIVTGKNARIEIDVRNNGTCQAAPRSRSAYQ